MTGPTYPTGTLERMGSPEQLDQLMVVTSPRAWIALSAAGLVLALVVLWSILGRIPTTVDGQGALVRIGGVVPVCARCAGRIISVVPDGTTVREGEVVVRLTPQSGQITERPVEILSPVAGRVLCSDVVRGNDVEEQTVLLTVEPLDSPLQAVVYVPAADGYCVQAGNEVQVIPASLNQRSARHLAGIVSMAGKWTASHNHMLDSLQNPAWVTALSSGGPLLEMIIELPADQLDKELPLYHGEPCRARITVDERRPIEFVFPALGGAQGG
jgi:hypothetical protein